MRKAISAKTYLSLEALFRSKISYSFQHSRHSQWEFPDDKRPKKEKRFGEELYSYLGRNQGATLRKMILRLGRDVTGVQGRGHWWENICVM